MSDHRDQSSRDSEPVDPWAPPERKVELDKPGHGRTVSDQPPTGQGAPGQAVHNQPTVTSMPAAPSDATPASGYAPPTTPVGPAGPVGGQGWAGPVPPPPTAPGGPGQAVPGSYGYPAYPGYPDYPGYAYGHPGWTGMGAPLNGFGTAAMVLGILSVVLFCLWGLGIILGILALIFGFLGRGRAKRGQSTNGGQSLAGIILGAVGIAVSGVFLGLMIWAVAHNHHNNDDSSTADDPFATSLMVGEGEAV
ncbi:DUF4190 domain-containing protein [Streptomyces sp. NPDC020719]|uniref:DUF4190 domain-containing protein n=1 Tax=unclassified Streptomyces TaxID=2593676 RepID=UPI0033D1C938